MIHRKIRLHNEIYWYHQNHEEFGTISPLDHYDDHGELLADPFNDISFAIVEGNDISRYGIKIADLSELEDVD